MDTIGYALGVTDEVKGTGVWKAFKLNREKEEEKDSEAEEAEGKNEE